MIVLANRRFDGTFTLAFAFAVVTISYFLR